jgi:TonB family protein
MKVQIRLHCLLSCFFLSVLAPIPVEAAPAAEPAPHERPQVLKALEKGMERLEGGQFTFALSDFKRAARLADGKCGPCFLGLARAHNALGDRENAAEAARNAISLLDRPDALAQAYNSLGVALSGDQEEDLAAAEAAFRKALELGPPSPDMVRVNLAHVLWREKKYAESERLARQVLISDPAAPPARDARIVLCQARADGAPVVPPDAVYTETACHKDRLRTVEENLVPVVLGQVTRPRKIFGRPAEYDESSRKEKIEGIVVLESIIDDEGCVQQLRICKSVHPSLDLDALDAVRHWVFQPAEFNGKPVKVYYTLTVNFTM